MIDGIRDHELLQHVALQSDGLHPVRLTDGRQASQLIVGQIEQADLLSDGAEVFGQSAEVS